MIDSNIDNNLDLNEIRKSFYLSDNERKIFDLSDKQKIDLALKLRSIRGSKKASRENISKKSKRVLLLNDSYRLFFINVSFENDRLKINSSPEPFLLEYIKDYPIIVEGYIVHNNSMFKSIISTGNDFEKLNPEVIVKYYDDKPIEPFNDYKSIQDKMINMKSSGINVDEVLKEIAERTR